jgi:hypothetical protein
MLEIAQKTGLKVDAGSEPVMRTGHPQGGRGEPHVMLRGTRLAKTTLR